MFPTLNSPFVVRGKNRKGKYSVPLNYSFEYLFAADKPLDHVHLKCMQLNSLGQC